MATPKTSIFDFADTFGYTSPFATDWIAEEAAKREQRDIAQQQPQNRAIADCTDYPPGKWWIPWFDREGHIIYSICKEYGFSTNSTNGCLVILAHAFKEQATTERWRRVGYQTHNWWNFGPVASRQQISKSDISSFAYFENITLATNAYIDRIDSPQYLVPGSIQNKTYNLSYPEVGRLLKLANLPTAAELNTAFRIGAASPPRYCHGSDYGDYGSEILQIFKKRIIPYFDEYFKFKINCINNKMTVLSAEDLEKAKWEMKYYQNIQNEINNANS